MLQPKIIPNALRTVVEGGGWSNPFDIEPSQDADWIGLPGKMGMSTYVTRLGTENNFTQPHNEDSF